MTRDDDTSDLAPVTPLFGARGGPVSVPTSRSAVGGHADAGSAGDEATIDGAATDEATTDGAATGEATTDGAATGEADQRDDRDAPAADPVSEAAAALAAISEHWSRPTADPVSDPAASPAAKRARLAAVPPIEVPDSASTDDADEEVEPEGLDAQRRRAENISLHALARRGVSSSEMTTLLRQRDLDEQVVHEEVARLEGVGLLNDRELAENLVRAKQDRKGLGKGAVTSELRQRGLDAAVVEEALADIDDDDEQARADEWARKRVGSLRGLDRDTAERRLNGYLMRRGYRSDVVRKAIEKVLPRGGSSRGGVRFE